jgi:hypothetical protein
VNPPQQLGREQPRQDSYPGLDNLELELSVQFAADGLNYRFARQLALDIRMTLEIHTPQYIIVTGIA